MKISIIDVEASGLGRGSYPIEIGLAMADGSARCMLIRPHQDWLHWDEEAEALHGIKREELMEYGTDVDEAATLLNQYLGNSTVYSDAWGNDSSWVGLLYECADLPQSFKVESLRSLLSEPQAALWHNVKDQVEMDLAFNRHRASNDARILQQTYYRSYDLSRNPSPF